MNSMIWVRSISTTQTKNYAVQVIDGEGDSDQSPGTASIIRTCTHLVAGQEGFEPI